ncbi:MAG TPA: DUF3592 domain-containing protein [Clostridiales bacterium]|nr:DUF3592 domain-containing protein [Clostridiales bacterium]
MEVALAMMYFCIPLAFILFGVLKICKYQKKKTEYITVSAEVLDFKISHQSINSSLVSIGYAPIVRFQTEDGWLITVDSKYKIEQYKLKIKIGDIIPVSYNPIRPRDIFLPTIEKSYILGAVLSFIIGFIFIAMGLLAYLTP